MAGFAVLLAELLESVVQLRQKGVERRLGNGRVAAERAHVRFLLVEVLQHLGFQVGAAGDVHHLEDGDQRVVVVKRAVARQQLAEAANQVLQPQVGANAFVERVFVQDHAEEAFPETHAS